MDSITAGLRYELRQIFPTLLRTLCLGIAQSRSTLLQPLTHLESRRHTQMNM